MSRPAPTILSAAAIATLCALSTGCEHFERARECRAVAKVVNPVLAKIDEARKKFPEDGPTHRRIAKDYDRLAISLVAQKPQNKRVQEVVADYQRLMREASRDTSQYADALGTKDDVRILAARQAASKTMKHEAGAVGHYESVCRGR